MSGKISASRMVHVVLLGDEIHGALPEAWRKRISIGFPDWTIRLWTEADLPALAGDCVCGRMLLDGSLSNPCRTAILRYELLRLRGGACVDAGLTLLMPLDEIMIEDCAHAGLLEDGTLDDGLLVSPAGHPFWDFLLRRIKARVNRHHGECLDHDRLAGPAALTEACGMWLADCWEARYIEVDGQVVGGLLEHGDWVLWKPEVLGFLRMPAPDPPSEHIPACFEQVVLATSPTGGPGVPETSIRSSRAAARSSPAVCAFTFSFNRLNFICLLIGLMKAQTETDFVHHIHLLDYPAGQGDFVRSMVQGDSRFVVSEHANLHQKENLMRILAELPQESAHFLKLDDDDIYLPTFLEAILKVANQSHADLTCFNTLLRYELASRKATLQPSSGLYGNTMCISRNGLRHLLTRPSWDAHGNCDGWIDAALEKGGFRHHIHASPQPYVLYLRHGGNVS